MQMQTEEFGKIAFVFSGQGAQFPGMGKDVYDSSPAARAIFETADRIRPQTSAQCFTADKETLSVTENTQPCLFTVDLAEAVALTERGVRPCAVAGFSLGEIAALAYAGVLETEASFRLICERARLMQAAAQAHPGCMYAVLGLQDDAVRAICADERLRCDGENGAWPVNYNCPGQIVAAMREELAEPFTALVKERGGKARRLQVSGAFHSPFMADAAEGLGVYLRDVTLRAPRIPVYANKTAEPYTGDPEANRTLIQAQVCNPVAWRRTVERMVADGIETFIEAGAGKVLCGLIAKTAPGVRVLHAEDLLYR